jgi:predicted metal-dependent peptidase
MEAFLKQKPAEELALDILQFSRNTLLINLRFLKMALYQFQFCSDPKTTLATDGQSLFYSFIHVLKSYRIQNELVIRGYLHIVLHCILHHPFVNRLVGRYCWDLACDIAVEAAIEELGLPCTVCGKSADQGEILKELRKALKYITAERVYHYYRERDLPPEQLATLREPFLTDTHDLWYQLSQRPGDDEKKAVESEDDHTASGNSAAAASRQQDEEPDSREAALMEPPRGKDGKTGGGERKKRPVGRAGVKQYWENISAGIQTDLETRSLRWGMQAGNLMQGLRECSRERRDYAAFLKRFAVNTEVIGLNDDEFDYIFYTYGLRLYGNMPLVEPLEYKDTKRIKEFIIAIDTSASVQGALVEKFIARTYDILKQTENFSTKMNLYIIQCDADIQEIKKITGQEDFDNYIHTMQLRGFGGTDFRPVFRYVDELQRTKKLTELKGLIYFTDGEGEYPAKRPDYDTAFVFVDDDNKNIQVPVWAMKVILTADEIEETETGESGLP